MDGKRLELTLPYCPTVNHYWLAKGKLRFLSLAAKEYRAAVHYIARLAATSCNLQIPFTGRLSVQIQVFPPDKRKRDIDNLLKASLDALAHAGIYEDDNQIDKLIIERNALDAPKGHLEIIITEL